MASFPWCCSIHIAQRTTNFNAGLYTDSPTTHNGLFLCSRQNYMAGDYHQEKKQQEAELISHFPLGSGQLATGRCTETTGMPPPPLPYLMSQSAGNKTAAAKMKRFSLLGFCPLNLPLFCPRAHFTSFTGGQTATWIQLCNVDCGVVRPASGADEWGIDKIDCAWQRYSR